MGLEVETSLSLHCSPMAPEELLQMNGPSFDVWSADDRAVARSKTASMSGLPKSSKKRAMPTAMRKSHSDKPLSQSTSSPSLSPSIATSASLESGMQDADDNQLSEPPSSSGRRQLIMDRADEIMHGKKQVGMQLGETCPVCLADDVDTRLSNCGHRVHAKCIKRWIYQSDAKCPVCREPVTGVEEAYSGPPSAIIFEPLEKDLADFTSEDTSSSDNQANEWGWFEEFDDFDDTMEEEDLIKHLHSRRRHSLQGQMLGGGSTSPLLNREMSTTFEVCRTFPPLRPEYDTLYADSKHDFMRSLPSHRHMAAKIQIRSFRIVETKSKTQHAEYLIELQLDRRYFSKWRRFSELSKFVGTLGTNQFHRTLAAWAELEAASRWFNRLEVPYLHRRCRMLEQFAHALLQEASTAHSLADLLEG